MMTAAMTGLFTHILTLYLGIGLGIAMAGLGLQPLRSLIAEQGGKVGMSARRAQELWTIGTCLFWPIGLYVLRTGDLVLAPDTDPNTAPPPGRLAAKALASSHADRSAKKTGGVFEDREKAGGDVLPTGPGNQDTAFKLHY